MGSESRSISPYLVGGVVGLLLGALAVLSLGVSGDRTDKSTEAAATTSQTLAEATTTRQSPTTMRPTTTTSPTTTMIATTTTEAAQWIVPGPPSTLPPNEEVQALYELLRSWNEQLDEAFLDDEPGLLCAVDPSKPALDERDALQLRGAVVLAGGLEASEQLMSTEAGEEYALWRFANVLASKIQEHGPEHCP